MMPQDRATRQQLFLGLLFASPFLVGFLLFTLYPLLSSLFLSFYDYDMAGPATFRGLRNYAALAHDSLFLKACWNTLAFTVIAVPVTMLVAFGLALLLNLRLKGRMFYRAVFFLPAVVPAAASAVMWRWLFPIHGWLDDPGWIKTVLVLMSVWGAGTNLILYLAALREVPRDLYEAAEVEGAGAWQRTWYVTIPSLGPVLFFTLVVGLIGGFQSFARPYVLTEGAAGHGSTLFAATYLFDNAFVDFRLGYAAAMGWALFLFIVICTALVFRAGRRFVQTP